MAWASLSSPVHVDHYSEDRAGADLSPLRRVVGTLAARDYAARLYAYTSLDRFGITSAPAYGEWDGSGTIVLYLYPASHLFEVRYDGFGKQDQARYRCEEFEVGRLVDALVLRMDLTRLEPDHPAIRRSRAAARD